MNILFDLDGTLTDPREGIVGSIKHALSTLKAPIPPESELESFIGPPLRDVFAQLLSGDSGRVEAAVEAYRDRFTALGMFENAVYDGIPEVLDSLVARDVQLYVATSKPRVYAEQILVHFGLSRHFVAIYGSELSGALSDKGELIAHVLETAALRPAETVMVRDRLHDIRGARRNQVLPVGVLWGYGSREELSAAGAERLFERPDELQQLVA